ncbi:acyl dehydratase [Rhodococcus sp. BP-252]|uniref:Acyl dehydratase n=1 Tax=Rhodococcoides kyotonense TaxID=398843 RepID=A0A177YLJ6_9NOCA|nr:MULTISPECIES: MaoC/PaaZ C-terminal domain-containing protein [Rhodococcus]MBY6412617.1 acyl dehydratase [Rhodococcus sp. BP-320]MBY6417128.1 acyl dehydratase [Rhodococcus sp. BP-321]MBY6423216.1 acyl dehydratase [Rhodococcus sp. BP-324]MBY6427152.1 acyl dehydratase [Rhodococcus sp. BP-323]MBY6432235.1 acyl dehydratase [Rhodococcus sp. BP-322]
MTTYFDDVTEGEQLPVPEYPLSMYRLVMAAGSNRDFNSIHHNSEYAKASGAPEAYANVLFLMGMWERAVRDWAGDRAVIGSVKGFSMKKFNLVGTTTTVHGTVVAKELRGDKGVVTVELVSRNSGVVTVGPGTIEVELPLQEVRV